MADVLDDTLQGTLDPKLKDLVAPTDRPHGGYLYCTACEHVIGHTADRIEVQGAHEHAMTNPYGITHHFGCYAQAPGVEVVGAPIAADSWFPGFSWRLAHCEGCGRHMGWVFERGQEGFCGLIVSQLRTE